LPAKNQDLLPAGGNMPGPLGSERSIKVSAAAQKESFKRICLKIMFSNSKDSFEQEKVFVKFAKEQKFSYDQKG
jgi:hypothetical protein